MTRPRRQRPDGTLALRNGLILLSLWSAAAVAGGGVVLSEDTCIITIGFYEAHFTAYQPETSGDEQFCEDLPAATTTTFVLDYLHRSLNEVPVDFRVIENVTGKGEFARIEDVEAIEDIGEHTVFYQEPVIRRDNRYLVEVDFAREGNYVGIVTAGHPTNDRIYKSVFPFSVGRVGIPWGWLGFGVAVLVAGGFLVSLRRIGNPAGEGNE